MMTDNYTLVGPVKQLVTMANLPLKGPIRDEQLIIIEQGGLLINGDKIKKVGVFNDLKHQIAGLNVVVLNLSHDVVCMPGLIDSHTHICFAGSRAKDYALRNAGTSYLDIAKSGGGIWDTVSKTREASIDELIQNTRRRAEKHLQKGITTIEVKSGYGLTVEHELKMLRAIKEVNRLQPADLISTCLAAHIVPKDFQGGAEEYLDIISNELFPKLQAQGLTNRIDAFIEDGAFTPQIIKPYFDKAHSMGFDITVHADQFSPGGSRTAVEYNAVSADHLEASTKKEIDLLAASNVVTTALPGASLGLGCNHAPARELLDAGAILSIASDWNPGSAPMGDLLTQAAILGASEKLTNAEVLAGITYRAAHALRLSDRGTLTTGSLADFTMFPTSDYREILYHQGQLKPNFVWKHGKIQYQLDN